MWNELQKRGDKMFEKALTILSVYPMVKLFLGVFITWLLSN